MDGQNLRKSTKEVPKRRARSNKRSRTSTRLNNKTEIRARVTEMIVTAEMEVIMIEIASKEDIMMVAETGDKTIGHKRADIKRKIPKEAHTAREVERTETIADQSRRHPRKLLRWMMKKWVNFSKKTSSNMPTKCPLMPTM